MIINNDNFAETKTSGIESSTDMEISETDKGVLQMILSEGLYSDPIGSLIREYTSNALDANREVNNDEPIIVSLKKDAQDKVWFKVQDFGIGISPDRMQNVVSKYAASTKRNRADQLGFYGLGMKSGLSYTDTFNIETIFDGTKYLYIMYKAEHNTKIDLISSFETEEGNGTTIAIALKAGTKKYTWDKYDSEYDEFVRKIKEQLAYFEGVYFDIDEFNNDFEIISSLLWKYSPLINTEHMHLCLDNVYYPIDWEKLGMEAIPFPVGLNFKVTDGLIPTPNREQLRMTPTIKQKIQERIALVADEFVNKYNETVNALDTIIDAWDLIGQDDKIYKLTTEKTYKELKINKLKGLTETPIRNLTVKGIEKLSLKKIKEMSNSFFYGYSIKGGVCYNRYSASYSCNMTTRTLISGDYGFFMIKEKPKNLLLDFMKCTMTKDCYFVHKAQSERKLGCVGASKWHGREYDPNGYYTLLELKNFPKEDWRATIKEYQMVEKQVHALIMDISTVVPDQAWLDIRKANRKIAVKVKVTKGEIYPKFAETSSRSDRNCTFPKSKKMSIEKLCDYPHMVVYSDSKEALDEVYGSFGRMFTISDSKAKKYNSHRIHFALLANRDFAKMKDVKIHNWKTIEEFMKGDNRPFQQYLTAYRIQKFMQNTSLFGDYKMKDIKKLSEPFYNRMQRLKKYCEEICDAYPQGEFVDQALKYAEKNNLWDQKIMPTFNYVKKKIKVFDFLNILENSYYARLEDNKFKLAVEILRGRKFLMNWQNYNIPMNPETEEIIFREEDLEDTEEDLTEELELAEEEAELIND